MHGLNSKQLVVIPKNHFHVCQSFWEVYLTNKTIFFLQLIGFKNLKVIISVKFQHPTKSLQKLCYSNQFILPVPCLIDETHSSLPVFFAGRDFLVCPYGESTKDNKGMRILKIITSNSFLEFFYSLYQTPNSRHSLAKYL